MYNQDVVDLYPRVGVGAKVTVTWTSYRGGGIATAAPTSGEARQPGRRVAAAAYAPGSSQATYSASTSAGSDDERTRRKYTSSSRKPVVKKAAPVKVRSAEVIE